MTAYAEAMDQVEIASVRAESLLSVVEDKIRAEPHVFIEFVKILESEPSLRSQAKQLVEKYLGVEGIISVASIAGPAPQPFSLPGSHTHYTN